MNKLENFHERCPTSYACMAPHHIMETAYIQYYQPYTGTAVLHAHFSIDPDRRTTELMVKDDDNECSH